MTLTSPVSLTEIPQNNLYRKGDVFVLFGELFGRGYVTGLLDQAKKAGMEIIGITVGRRDENNKLRPLTEEELAQAEANLGGRPSTSLCPVTPTCARPCQARSRTSASAAG